ncbi:MAG: hypothetical protein GTO22_15995 [Gemmatimonadales bacterium]|nr:hypothetical protein [Gemmatimonadales bacterium]
MQRSWAHARSPVRRPSLQRPTARGVSQSSQYPFDDPNLPEEERVSDLIGRMTLEEKIGALGRSAAVPRLGVKGSPHIAGGPARPVERRERQALRDGGRQRLRVRLGGAAPTDLRISSLVPDPRHLQVATE